MVGTRRKALERTWKDRCNVFVQEKRTDPVCGLTDFEETLLCEDLPCKLSFESLTAVGNGSVAALSQSVKLFLAPEQEIPAGCKIVVTRAEKPERQLIYTRSGEPGLFTDHQEILLVPFREYA